MKFLLIAVGIVVVLVIVVVAVGYSLPVKHQSVGDATLKASPDVVYQLITNVGAFPSWRTGVTAAEVLQSQDGRSRFRETSSNGAITYVIEVADRDHRLVTRIDDKTLPFGGTWTYEIAPASAGHATLRITEDGEIYNPIFRFVSRYFMGYDTTIKTYLADATRKLSR